jgi:thioredoxin 1
MSDADEIERLREKRRQELEAQLGGGDAAETEADDGAASGAGPDEPIHVDGPDHLQDLVDSYDVVLADFYADWCGPCKMIEPIVAALAAETDAAVAKVDVDVHQRLAQQYQVQGVPTLFLFADGEAVERITGAAQRGRLESLIDQYS